MKKIFFVLLSASLSVSTAFACTNFIVGKKASADGSVFVTYNADSYGAFMPLYHYPAAKHAAGEMRKVYEWDTNKYLGEIAEAAETYNVIGNSNEWQVTIGETTFGGREEMADSTGIIDYGSLIYIALQRSKTAREALQVMTSLVEQYGYCSEGETFSVADKDEAWMLEMMGCGPDRTKEAGRTVWVAVRIPDNAVAAHANQSRITKFLDGRYVQVKMKDLLNPKAFAKAERNAQKLKAQSFVVFSDNVVSYARTMGWFDGKDEDFSYNAAYAKPDFSGRRYCEARVWSFFNRFADDFSEYVPYAAGIEKDAKEMPLWIIPNKLVTLQDLRDAMRDHYEGTPFALDQKGDIGGGIFQMPYRPSPLSFKVDDVEYFNERPISTQQTAWSFISQMRSSMPREVGACFWFGNDDGNMVAYTPMYSCITRVPKCFSGEGADDVTFSIDNAFWVCNWVSNMVYPRYSMMFPSLKEVRDSLDASYTRLQPEIEAKALALATPEERIACLTDYSCKKGDEMIARWQQLAFFLIVKYNDMVMKPTDEQGRFLRNKYGGGQKVVRPGFPEAYARELLNQTGSKYLVPSVQTKKVSILGDSYSTFQGVIPAHYAPFYPNDRNDCTKVEQTWWDLYIKAKGYVLEKNDSWGGTTICSTGYGRMDVSRNNFISRVDSLGNPDIIFVFGGTNDAWANSPVGEYQYSDWTKEDCKNFRPALACLLDMLQKRYPNAKICSLLNSELREPINESMREICKHYDVQLIELHDIEKQNGHPSVNGMKSICAQLLEAGL